MSGTDPALLKDYTSLLKRYVSGAGEDALQRAYARVRGALAEGLGLMEMVAIHNEAARRVLRSATSGAEAARMTSMAGVFLLEALSPFEITHRAFGEANTALHRMNDRLEEVARRIAHSLHDEAGQLLVAIHLALDAIARDLPPGPRARLSGVNQLLEDIGQRLRRLSHELRPTILDDLGLMPALGFLAEGVSGRTGVPIAVEGDLGERLEPSVELALYRVVQEGLNNLAKHAHATRAAVWVSREDGTVHCSIRDNGLGFDVAAVLDTDGHQGLGLIGIRERLNPLGGTLQIISARGQGTELRIAIPTKENHHETSHPAR